MITVSLDELRLNSSWAPFGAIDFPKRQCAPAIALCNLLPQFRAHFGKWDSCSFRIFWGAWIGIMALGRVRSAPSASSAPLEFGSLRSGMALRRSLSKG